jgi:hypothetical protein
VAGTKDRFQVVAGISEIVIFSGFRSADHSDTKARRTSCWELDDVQPGYRRRSDPSQGRLGDWVGENGELVDGERHAVEVDADGRATTLTIAGETSEEQWLRPREPWNIENGMGTCRACWYASHAGARKTPECDENHRPLGRNNFVS